MSPDIPRRRKILTEHIGEPIALKRAHRPKKLPRTIELAPATLVDVKRLKAVVQFGPPRVLSAYERVLTQLGVADPVEKDVFGLSGEWSLPLEWLLLPGSTEPAPGQLSLFEEAQP